MLPTLQDGRSYLPIGTTLLFDNKDYYRISGNPIGCGGTGILYPIVSLNDSVENETSIFVLKEYYPIHAERMNTGEIVISNNHFKGQLDNEKNISCKIFESSSSVTPVLKVYHQAIITVSGEEQNICNDYALMERLDQKAVVLSNIIIEKQPLWVYVHIIGKLLAALSGIHDAGFLHLDIKGNNIFLRDWDSSEILNSSATFIDFGSTLPLKETGETAPVKTRDLFTTEGFAAPECRDTKQNYVALTRSADLYSVGCLLLYMILGHKNTFNSLTFMRGSSSYISKREADRLGCSNVGRNEINRILNRALKVDPSERYQTAQEMLVDVRRLERLLSPSPDPLDLVDWEAFIAFSDEDDLEENARKIQRAIECYRIPPQIKRSYGVKRIGRVYTPQTDASSRSDETDHRESIIKNSRVLIVLLSKTSASNQAVMRDISKFLENHSLEKVLFVRTDECDMENEIPSLLRGRFMVDGVRLKFVEAITQPADLREITRRKINQELHRVIAPMIGCSPDELIEREKQYRKKRILISVAVTAMLLVLLSMSVIKVYYSTQKKLAAENVMMTDAAATLFQEGDRSGAVRQLLAVLPSKDNKRPYYPAAEQAMVDYLHPYYKSEIFNSYVLVRGTVIEMDKAFSNHFSLSADGDTVFSWCEYGEDSIPSYGVVKAYNAYNGNLKWKIEVEGDINSCISLEDGTILVDSSKTGVHAFSSTGTEKWVYNKGDTYFASYGHVNAVGEKSLLVEDSYLLYTDGDSYTYGTDYSLISLTGGELIHDIEHPNLPGYAYFGIEGYWEPNDNRYNAAVAFSEDDNILAILWYGKSEDDMYSYILTIDDIRHNTRKTITLSEQHSIPSDGFVSTTSNGNLQCTLVQFNSEESETTLALQMNSYTTDGALVQHNECNYECPCSGSLREGLMLDDDTLMLNLDYGIAAIDAIKCKDIYFIPSDHSVLSITDVSNKLEGAYAVYALLADGRFVLLSRDGKWEPYFYERDIGKMLATGISFTGENLTSVYSSFDCPDRIFTIYWMDFETKAEADGCYFADAPESNTWGYEVSNEGIRVYNKQSNYTLLEIADQPISASWYGKIFDVPGENAVLLCVDGEYENGYYGDGYYIDTENAAVRQKIPSLCGFNPTTRDIWVWNAGYHREHLYTTEELIDLAHDYVDECSLDQIKQGYSYAWKTNADP